MSDVERRLAAILALDVVGFSRMMGSDETGTLDRLKAIRADIIDPAIAERHGRIVKLMGDGMLVEFDSAVNAVQCAVDVQAALKQAASTLSDDKAMHVRIGINMGDIIIEGEDIYGDGVNVAARLESIADTGGIYISGSVHDSVNKKLDATFDGLGEVSLKNIDHPVRVFRVHMGADAPALANKPPRPVSGTLRQKIPPLWIAAAVAVLVVGGGVIWNAANNAGTETTETTKTVAAATEKAPPVKAIKATKPTIAVLPFNNFSDDKEQEYFSDGLTEDLITDISKISGLAVIARNSTFSYKGQSPDVREVGKALGASHVIEGSVRKSGNAIRITVQLINAADGKHLWAERYDRELKDVFAIQDDVIGRIIAALSLKLTPEEKKRVAHHSTENLEAYDLFMRGRQQESFFNKDAFVDAQRYYERSLELDPNYAEAMARLAQIHAMNGQFGWVDDIEAADQRALGLGEKSVVLGPNIPFAHFGLSRILARDSINRHEDAIGELKTAIELDPNYADAYAYLAQLYILTGQAERAPAIIKTAMSFNPNHPFWYFYTLGYAHLFMNDYETAVENIEKAVEANPTILFYRTALAASLALGGHQDDAEWQIDELVGLGFNKSLEEFISESPVRHSAYRKLYREGLSKAGLE